MMTSSSIHLDNIAIILTYMHYITHIHEGLNDRTRGRNNNILADRRWQLYPTFKDGKNTQIKINEEEDNLNTT